MRTILVANPKGGCGKTTLATNLAAYLAGQNQRVAMWDLDRQKSSLDWLALRAAELPAITSLDADRNEINPVIPDNNDWLVLDSPAGIHGKNLAQALKLAHKIVVPVQPSIFDMAATRDFLDRLMEEKAVRKHKAFIGIIGMRVDPRTRAAATLEQFLKQYDLPILTYLRDTMVYVNAAFTGKSIFDLPSYLAERDLTQWQPLIEWVET
ncbi:chromosome partitioning protein [Nitrosospira sp. Nl5]|uniref:ParA family protein n=1 Tax=Nitrosospira sp. Nl5 TaxID=200120 RepID=UPI000880077D|nr:ParA family protein [Nitrosospira sp. Nl5]SCY45225.1 chromosome partitioning protein [Nitrosospira sp. Nl5]